MRKRKNGARNQKRKKISEQRETLGCRFLVILLSYLVSLLHMRVYCLQKYQQNLNGKISLLQTRLKQICRSAYVLL